MVLFQTGNPLRKKGRAPEVYRAIELYRQERSVQANRTDGIRQGCCEEHGTAADGIREKRSFTRIQNDGEGSVHSVYGV